MSAVAFIASSRLGASVAVGDGVDTSWVRSAQAGDQAAFGRLYARFAPMVHGVLVAQLPVSEAEDLVQEVFVQAMRKLPTLRDPAAFAPWLAAIARRRALDRHRQRGAVAKARSDDETQGVSPAVPAEAEAVLAVIRGLPRAYRETLVLRLVEGMTGPEIAARTGLTPESVRVNLHRGMKKLRAALGAAAGEGR